MSTIIVLVVVVAAVAFAFVRVKKHGGCSCGNKKDCHSSSCSKRINK